jgi:hypothetical protein
VAAWEVSGDTGEAADLSAAPHQQRPGNQLPVPTIMVAAGVTFGTPPCQAASSITTWAGPSEVHKAQKVPRSGFVAQLEEQAERDGTEEGEHTMVVGIGRLSVDASVSVGVGVPGGAGGPRGRDGILEA